MTPEFIFLETACIPLRYTITIRRMMYHQSILLRSNEELMRRLYEELKLNPVKGDWIDQLKEYFKFIGESFNVDYAKINTKSKY